MDTTTPPRTPDLADTPGDRPTAEPGGPDAPAPEAEVRDDLVEVTVPDVLVRLVDRLRSTSGADWVSLVVVTVCTVFVFVEVNPDNLVFADTTPTGGDMGAHVWGPAFLRDELLPNFQLAGWAPDWYAGFPAYQFYFVLPALVIVALNVGLAPVGALAVVVAAGAAVVLSRRSERFTRVRGPILALAIVAVILAVGMPYGVAFKIVAISGLVGMPMAAWALGRLAALPFPGPPLLAVASLLFVFDRSFNITGGNGASTMAGEFSFSIAITLALVYLGLLIRGLRTGEGLGWAALVLAITGLCHIIPAFYAVAATFVVLALRFGRSQIRFVALTGVLAGLVSAFWVLPFVLREDYVNNMGWEKKENYYNYLFTRADLDADFLTDSPPLLLFLVLALGGFVVSIALRRRLGILLGLWAIGAGAAFVLVPEGRLWNLRILPFYYLCIYLLAAVGASEVLRLAARGLAEAGPRRDPGLVQRWATNAVPVVGAVVVLIMLGLPLGALPGGDRGADGVYSWGPFRTAERNFVPGWAKWNFAGYEGRVANADGGGYEEYFGIVTTMDEVGAERGCGRAMWEYAPELGRYGTPMAMMLLPHWTDGCIGSMEGLYFEASATVPYHFLVQSELSGPRRTEGERSVGGPSRPMRGLTYPDFDIEAGVDHLQMLGVSYYLAFSETAVNAADAHPDLEFVTRSGPWHVYEVADAPLVEPLDLQPVVFDDVDEHQHGWLDPAVEFFSGYDADEPTVYRAATGPDEWQRVSVDPETGVVTTPIEQVPTQPVQVTDLEVERDRISFSVDQVGQPVLVKVSYFPNWSVSGADGPYRVTPNLMVVVPTDTEVELTYGRTWVEWFAYTLTAIGIVGIVIAFRRGSGPRTEPWFDPVAAGDRAVARWRAGPVEAPPGLAGPVADGVIAAEAGPAAALGDGPVVDDPVPDGWPGAGPPLRAEAPPADAGAPVSRPSRAPHAPTDEDPPRP